jgi:hypothetical protein
MSTIAATILRSLTEPKGKRTHLDLQALLAAPLVSDEREGLPLWSPTTYNDNYRDNAHAKAVGALTYDVDAGGIAESRLRAAITSALPDIAVYVHSTHSATADAPRWRIIVPLAARIAASEHPRQWRHVAGLLGSVGVDVDMHASDVARAYDRDPVTIVRCRTRDHSDVCRLRWSAWICNCLGIP